MTDQPTLEQDVRLIADWIDFSGPSIEIFRPHISCEDDVIAAYYCWWILTDPKMEGISVMFGSYPSNLYECVVVKKNLMLNDKTFVGKGATHAEAFVRAVAQMIRETEQ